MNAQEFRYWMQGFAELGKAPPTKEQWKAINDHLQLVFTKVTPTYKALQPVIACDLNRLSDFNNPGLLRVTC